MKLFNIGIKHGFPCINLCQVPREMLKTGAEGPEGDVENEAEGRGFQQLARDLAKVNARLLKAFGTAFYAVIMIRFTSVLTSSGCCRYTDLRSNSQT